MKTEELLEQLINSNLHQFLRSRSEETLRVDLLKLRLSRQQYEFYLTLHSVACCEDEDQFQGELEHRNSAKLFPLKLNDEYSPRDSQQIYTEMLKGKRVVLVGPSQPIIGSSGGELIDSFDYVVRLNFQWPILKHLEIDLGRRMDILYHCCNGDFPINQIFDDAFNETKFVCYEKNIDSRVLVRHCNANNIPNLDISEVYRLLAPRLGTYPNTGTVAIAHLLNFPISELFITGITFFREPYYPNYKGDGAQSEYWKDGNYPEEIHQHKMRPQLIYCRELVSSDSRVRVDSSLQKILDECS